MRIDYFKLIISVIVRVKRTKYFTVNVNFYIIGALQTFGQMLPCVLLHLNVKELAKVAEPFDQLGRVGLVEFDVRKEVAQYGRTWVPSEKEHQLRFSQMK